MMINIEILRILWMQEIVNVNPNILDDKIIH